MDKQVEKWKRKAFLDEKIPAPQVPVQNKEEKKIITTSYKHELNLSTTVSTVIHFVVIRKGLPPETRQKKKLRFKCNHPNIPIQKYSCNIHTYILWHLYSLKNHPRIFIMTNQGNVSCW